VTKTVNLGQRTVQKREPLTLRSDSDRMPLTRDRIAGGAEGTIDPPPLKWSHPELWSSPPCEQKPFRNYIDR